MTPELSTAERPSSPPLTKGERTRQQIIQQVAPLFNQKGYSGTSMSDVIEATGLQKGGIYRHFESKEELALAAFDYAMHLHFEFVEAFMNKAKGSKEKLLAMLDAFCSLKETPLLPGGCPLLNTGIESDDTNPNMKARVIYFYQAWRKLIASTIQNGQSKREIKPEIDAESNADLMIAQLEGSMFLCSLHNDSRYAYLVVDHIRQDILIRF